MALLFAFAPKGACQAAVLPRRWWSLTPPFQLFSHLLAQAAGVFFSAALSVGLPRPAVSRLSALWSPDFPHVPCGTRGHLAHFAPAIVSQLPANAHWACRPTRDANKNDCGDTVLGRSPTGRLALPRATVAARQRPAHARRLPCQSTPRVCASPRQRQRQRRLREYLG